MINRLKTFVRIFLVGASLTPMPAQGNPAAEATSRATLKVQLSFPDNPALSITPAKLKTSIISQSGYGAHYEEADGSIGLSGLTFTEDMYSFAIAQAPPASDARITYGSSSVLPATIENLSPIAQNVRLGLFYDLYVLAYAAGQNAYASTDATFSIQGAVDTGGTARFAVLGDDAAAATLNFGNSLSVATSEKTGIDEKRIVIDRNFDFRLLGKQSYQIYNNFGSVKSVALAVPDDVVPEPASWAMLIVGFAVTGSALRRRRAFARVQ